jgi:hypothetical protein
MEKINQFSMQRFILLMQRYLMFNSKTWLIGAGAIAGTLIVIALLQTYFAGGRFNLAGLVNTGQTFIFISGLIITSMAYNEIHVPARSQFFLTLPATTSEKLLSHWLITSVLFIIIANVLLTLILLLPNLVAAAAWNSPISVFNPFTQANLRLMSIYVVIQSIFFLGAIYFRHNNFLKTILSLFVISIIVNIIGFIIMYLAFGATGFQGNNFELVDPDFAFSMERIFPLTMKIIFYAIIVPFCLVVSYFKLKEREV